MRKPVIASWPNDAKIVVMVTILYESWSKGVVPGHSPMALASPLEKGTLDLQGISWAEYGGETGIWRIGEILDRAAVKATFCTNAQVVERYRESVLAIHKAGHEIAAHSYTQDALLPYMTPAEEADMIRRCTGIIGDATGTPPTGWISPRATCTLHTPGLLADAGYRWHGDYNDTDLPYVVDTGCGDLVALMHSDFTDVRVILGSPRNFHDVYIDMFDFLYESGRPEIINLSIHAHFGGRPMMAAMFAKILAYFGSFDRVSFASHEEVAKWTLRDRAASRPTGMLAAS